MLCLKIIPRKVYSKSRLPISKFSNYHCIQMSKNYNDCSEQSMEKVLEEEVGKSLTRFVHEDLENILRNNLGQFFY